MRGKHSKRLEHIRRRPLSMSGDMRAATQVAQALPPSPPGDRSARSQLSMKISAARGLSSSPAMRGRPGRSVQGIWAGIARWHTCSCHALRPRRSETSRNPPLCTFPARPRSSCLLKIRWFDDASRAPSNHVVAARRGRTAWTAEVHQARSDTFRLELSDPANLGLDPAVYP